MHSMCELADNRHSGQSSCGKLTWQVDFTQHCPSLSIILWDMLASVLWVEIGIARTPDTEILGNLFHHYSLGTHFLILPSSSENKLPQRMVFSTECPAHTEKAGVPAKDLPVV